MKPQNTYRDKKSKILYRIVCESLAVSPDDAHLKVLKFLKDKGISPEEEEDFRNAWSKIVIGNRSFGRDKAITASPLNPDLFAHELVTELSRDTDCQDVVETHLSILKGLTESVSSIEISEDTVERNAASLNKIIEKGKEVTEQYQAAIKQLYSMPAQFLSLEKNEERAKLQYMMDYQDAYSNRVRIVWRKSELGSSNYNPIYSDILFDHGYRSGKLAFKSEKASNMPPYISADDVIGLVIKFDHSSALENCFETVGFLWEFISCRYFNMFPKPYEVIHNDDLSVVFAFERPRIQKYTKFLNSKLPSLLRENTTIVHTWCTQLSVTARALHQLKARPYYPYTINDLLITEDGLLLLQNVGFDENEYFHRTEDEEGDNVQILSGKSAKETDNFNDFLPFVYRVLTTSLASSRVEIVHLPEVSSFRAAGFSFENPEAAFDVDSSSIEKTVIENLDVAEELQLDLRQTAKHQEYQTFAITSGSRLDIELFCGKVVKFLKFDYLEVYGPMPETALSREDNFFVLHVVEKILYDDVNTSNQSSSVKTSTVTVELPLVENGQDSEECSATVIIEAERTGVIYLEFSVALPNFDKEELSKLCLGAIRIQVIDNTPAHSVEVQELLAHLEVYHEHRIPSTILNTLLFQSAQSTLEDDEKARDMIVKSTLQWSKIKKGIEKSVIKKV